MSLLWGTRQYSRESRRGNKAHTKHPAATQKGLTARLLVKQSDFFFNAVS